MVNEGMEPRYVISIAARIIGVQTHTLRYYERIGVVSPGRSRGNIRLYSDEDILLLKRVKTLMDDLGVNLAGVEVILRLSAQMAEVQRRNAELQEEVAGYREAAGGR